MAQMMEVWPAAQAEVAAELGTGQPDAIVFAPNTHDFLVRLLAAASESQPVRVLTSDGEFHSARRQLQRLEEEGIEVVRVASRPTILLGTFGTSESRIRTKRTRPISPSTPSTARPRSARGRR